MLVAQSLLASLVFVLCLSAPNASVLLLPDDSPSPSPLRRRGVHDYAKDQNSAQKGLNVKDYVDQGLKKAEEAKQKRLTVKMGKAAKECWGALCGRRTAKHVDAQVSRPHHAQPEHPRRQQHGPQSTVNEEPRLHLPHVLEKARPGGSSTSVNSRTNLLTSGTSSRRTKVDSVDWSGHSDKRKKSQQQQHTEELPKLGKESSEDASGRASPTRKIDTPLARQKGFRERPRDFHAKYSSERLKNASKEKEATSPKFNLKSMLNPHKSYGKTGHASKTAGSNRISAKEADTVKDPFLPPQHPNKHLQHNQLYVDNHGKADLEHDMSKLDKIDEESRDGRSSRAISLVRSRHSRQDSIVPVSPNAGSAASFGFPFPSDTSKHTSTSKPTSKQTSFHSSRQSSENRNEPKWSHGSQHIWGIFRSSRGPSATTGASQHSASLGWMQSGSHKASSGKSSFSFLPGGRHTSEEHPQAHRLEPPKADEHKELPKPQAQVGMTSMAGLFKKHPTTASSPKKASEPRQRPFLPGPAQSSEKGHELATEQRRRKQANRQALMEIAESVQERPSTVGSSSSQKQPSKGSSENYFMHNPVRLSMGAGTMSGSKHSNEALGRSGKPAAQVPSRVPANPESPWPERMPKATVGKPDWKFPEAPPDPWALREDQKPKAVVGKPGDFPQREPSLPKSEDASKLSDLFSTPNGE